MGGDGGCINNRADMVRTKGYGFSRERGVGGFVGGAYNVQRRIDEETVDPKLVRRLRTSQCRLSQEALQVPICADRMGNLFNKDVLIAKLLAKELPDFAKHIKGLRDVRDLQVSFKKDSDGKEHMYCPITSQDIDDGFRRPWALFSCGHLISRDAILMVTGKTAGAASSSKQISDSKASTVDKQKFKDQKGGECPICNEKFEPNDIVPICGTEEENEVLKERVEAILAEKAAKKGKKRKKESKDKDGFDVPTSPPRDGKKAKKEEKSAVYKSLFAKPGEKEATDAWGRGYSNRGSGL